MRLIQCFFFSLLECRKADGEEYEPGSLNTIYVLCNKCGKGNLDNPLICLRHPRFGNCSSVSWREHTVHCPAALWTSMVIICLSLGRRERTELRAKRFEDLIIEVVDGNQFITLDKERLSKTRQGEDARNMRHFRLSGLFALLSCYDLLEVLLHETRSCGRS